MNNKRVVIMGGCGLSFGASFANTGLVLMTGTSVSHLTGDIAKMTVNLANWSGGMSSELGRVGAAALCFLVGAMIAGFLIHHPTLDISRPYGRTISSIGVLLVCSGMFVERHPVLSISFAALGCGLQNALAAHYRGIILRTTHLTGMFTDFGVTLGMRLRGYAIPRWKIAVPFLIIVSFFIGGVSSAMMHFSGYDTIFIAGVGYVVAGLSWTIWKHFLSKKMREK